MSRKICVSFDYDNDKEYYFLLRAWSRNSKFDFSMEDCTPNEIQSDNIGRIKAVLTEKIGSASMLVVLVGKESHKIHPMSSLIGFQNWQNFEIAKAKELGKKIVAVKIDNSFTSPTELLRSGASWAKSFSEESIMSAISNGI